MSVLNHFKKPANFFRIIAVVCGLFFVGAFVYSSMSNSDSTSVSDSGSQPISKSDSSNTPSSKSTVAVTSTTSTTTTTTPSNTTTSDGLPVIYVNIASHSEDGTSIGYPDFLTDTDDYATERAGVVKFAQMVNEHGAKYNYQSDWNFLLALNAYDKGDSTTNGKNLLRYLVEDLGDAVDPHSHEKNGYNYADVAYLVSTLGVEPSHVVGGFIASPESSSKLSYLSTLTHGSKYPSYEWKPEILWGGGTGNHVNEEALWISGVWRPKSASAFTTDDPNALPNVGHYESDWDGLDKLLALQSAGSLTSGQIYTVTIMNSQPDFTESYVEAFSKKLDEYTDEVSAGRIIWTTIEGSYDAWVNTYNSVPSTLLFSGTASSSSGPSAHGSSSSSGSTPSSISPNTKPTDHCGDGVCVKVERISCPEDCE